MDLPDNWYTHHDGQRLILDSGIVAAEFERLSAKWIAETRENERLRAALKPFADLAPKLDAAPNLVGILPAHAFQRAADAIAVEQSQKTEG